MPTPADRRPQHPRAGARLGLALMLVLLAGAQPACRPTPAEPGRGRGVLLISIDALRADHVSSNGYDRRTTPELDALASAGVSFADTWATAPWNLPSCASLLTGCDPFITRRRLAIGIPSTVATRWNIPRQAPRLAQEFLREGWATAAFVDDPVLAPVHGFLGGFQTYIMGAGEGSDTGPQGLSGQPLRLVQWLQTQDRDQDWFAFLHLADLERSWQASDPLWDTYFEPRSELAAVPPVGDAEHLFHAIPRRRWSGGLHTLGEYEARYDGALRRLDAALGRLLARLERMGRLEETTICVVGTHGLGFGEAGLILDHGTLSAADLRVPWILKAPASAELPVGRRVDALASLLDVAPTLLELAEVRAQSNMHGVSFVPHLRGFAEPPRQVALARSGLQDGYLVIESRWLLELTRPWIVDAPILATSWYGGPPPEDARTRQVLVDRSGARVTPDQAEAQTRRLCELGLRWIQEVERMRQSLQTVDWLLKRGLELQQDAQPLGPCAPAAAGAEGSR